MQMSRWRFALVPLALVGAAWLSASRPVAEGEQVEFKFREAPVNAAGVKGLGDLRGVPVLIDFWGKN
ncbi:MAG: hypothetical protein FJ298_05735 [Planctomycetes bacterium]|nr:hypothetical protein [Planctomycetota bacterium]